MTIEETVGVVCAVEFDPPSMEVEFEHLCGPLRLFLRDLAGSCKSNGRPAPVVTHVIRTEEQQRRLYKLGPNDPLRFTWHFALPPLAANEAPEGHAVDLRTRHLDAKALATYLHFCADNCPREQWEVLYHDVGAGMHLHVGVKSVPRYKLWLARHPT